jgi:hypothetical protein
MLWIQLQSLAEGLFGLLRAVARRKHRAQFQQGPRMRGPNGRRLLEAVLRYIAVAPRFRGQSYSDQTKYVVWIVREQRQIGRFSRIGVAPVQRCASLGTKLRDRPRDRGSVRSRRKRIVQGLTPKSSGGE